MKNIALVYHSAHGHTEHIARHVADGASLVAGTRVHVLQADQLAQAPERLVDFDGVLMGSPTYLGGVSATFLHHRVANRCSLQKSKSADLARRGNEAAIFVP